MYHEISDRKKQNYLDKAEKAKEEYQEKMKEFMYDRIPMLLFKRCFI